MSNQQSRSDIIAWAAIALGIVLGIFLKRVKFGFIFGMALGITAVYLLWSKKKN